jgi:hypothetical protein
VPHVRTPSTRIRATTSQHGDPWQLGAEMAPSIAQMPDKVNLHPDLPRLQNLAGTQSTNPFSKEDTAFKGSIAARR